jgi:hypothetical protein
MACAALRQAQGCYGLRYAPAFFVKRKKLNKKELNPSHPSRIVAIQFSSCSVASSEVLFIFLSYFLLHAQKKVTKKKAPRAGPNSYS